MIVFFFVNIFCFVGCIILMYLWMLIVVNVKMDVSRKNMFRKLFNWYVVLLKIYFLVIVVIIENGMYKSVMKIFVRFKLMMNIWVFVWWSLCWWYIIVIIRKFLMIVINIIRYKIVVFRILIYVGFILLFEWDLLVVELLVLLLFMLNFFLLM